MTPTHLTASAAVILGLGLAGAGGLATADAATKAPTTVTIQAQGTDLSGTVKSTKPKVCAKGRKVLLVKQVGTRGGGDDKVIASDTADLQNGVYVWSTGNTGIEGKFYAKVRPTTSCQGDTSPTVRAVRNP